MAWNSSVESQLLRARNRGELQRSKHSHEIFFTLSNRVQRQTRHLAMMAIPHYLVCIDKNNTTFSASAWITAGIWQSKYMQGSFVRNRCTTSPDGAYKRLIL